MNKMTETKPVHVERVERAGFQHRLAKALDKEGFPPINRGRIQRLADIMGLSHRGAGKWLDGATTPPAKKCPFLAEKLRVDTEWLITGKGNMVRETSGNNATLPYPISTKDVPLYTLEDLNNPYLTPAHSIGCYVSTSGKTFALKVDTEAMSPRFPMGCFIIVDTGRVAKDGDFVLVQTTHFPAPQFRQLFIVNQVRYLDSDNPKFDRITLSLNDKIIGVIVQSVLLFV